MLRIAANLTHPDPGADSRFFCGLLLSVILGGSFLLKLNHLGHASIKALDESFHALVAKNLLKHPLTPTLYDKPWLPYDYQNWQGNHVWLHKPIVPLWQMALSMALLGTSPLALRLPSAILATAAVWLTYAIGRDLLGDRRAALIAALLQAINPAITSLVHGYVFSDHIDIAFLFWVELAIWCLVRAVRGESIRWLIAAGIAQGVAFLCKTYPAFIVTGIAIVAALLNRKNLKSEIANLKSQISDFRFRQVAVLLGVTLITIAPWAIWCLTHFSREFLFEQLQVFRHLGTNVENWAAPWDRLMFDYLVNVYQFFYPAVIVAAIVLGPRAFAPSHPYSGEREKGLLLIYAWGLGVLIPHLLATSKTPSATLIGWPAFLLLLGAMISRGIDGDRWSLGGWVGAAVLAAVMPVAIARSGLGYPDPPSFAVILRQNIWVIWEVVGALIVAFGVSRWLGARGRPAVIVIASAASLLIAGLSARDAWKLTARAREQPSFANLGPMLSTQLPPNAVLLMEIRERSEHIIAMFWIDRGIYPVQPATIAERARQVRGAGGEPFLLTNRALPLPPLMTEFVDGMHLYQVPEIAPATNPLPAPTTSP